MNKKNLILPAIALAFVVTASNVHAAADPDLANAIASSTGMFTDNKGQVLTYIAWMIGATTLFAMAIAALYFGKGQILSLFKRKGKKKK